MTAADCTCVPGNMVARAAVAYSRAQAAVLFRGLRKVRIGPSRLLFYGGAEFRATHLHQQLKRLWLEFARQFLTSPSLLGQFAQQTMQHTPLIDSHDPPITPETVSRLPSSRRAPGPPSFGRRNDAIFTPSGSSPNIRYNCAPVCLPSFALPTPVSPSPAASVPGSTPTNMSTGRVGACCWPIPGSFPSAHRPM